jgi:hypothetical protein
MPRQRGGKRFTPACSVCRQVGHSKRTCPTLGGRVPHETCPECGACAKCDLPHEKDCRRNPASAVGETP